MNLQSQTQRSDMLRDLLSEVFPHYRVAYDYVHSEIALDKICLDIGGVLTSGGQQSKWELKVVVQADQICIVCYNAPEFHLGASMPRVDTNISAEYFQFQLGEQRDAWHQLTMKRLAAINVITEHNTRLSNALVLLQIRLLEEVQK